MPNTSVEGCQEDHGNGKPSSRVFIRETCTQETTSKTSQDGSNPPVGVVQAECWQEFERRFRLGSTDMSNMSEVVLLCCCTRRRGKRAETKEPALDSEVPRWRRVRNKCIFATRKMIFTMQTCSVLNHELKKNVVFRMSISFRGGWKRWYFIKSHSK